MRTMTLVILAAGMFFGAADAADDYVFVLDVSRSMRQDAAGILAKSGRDSNHARAAAALADLVRGVPDGSLVSVGFFGNDARMLDAREVRSSRDREALADAILSAKPTDGWTYGVKMLRAVRRRLLSAHRARPKGRKLCIVFSDGRDEPPPGREWDTMAPEEGGWRLAWAELLFVDLSGKNAERLASQLRPRFGKVAVIPGADLGAAVSRVRSETGIARAGAEREAPSEPKAGVEPQVSAKPEVAVPAVVKEAVGDAKERLGKARDRYRGRLSGWKFPYVGVGIGAAVVIVGVVLMALFVRGAKRPAPPARSLPPAPAPRAELSKAVTIGVPRRRGGRRRKKRPVRARRKRPARKGPARQARRPRRRPRRRR